MKPSFWTIESCRLLLLHLISPAWNNRVFPPRCTSNQSTTNPQPTGTLSYAHKLDMRLRSCRLHAETRGSAKNTVPRASRENTTRFHCIRHSSEPRSTSIRSPFGLQTNDRCQKPRTRPASVPDDSIGIWERERGVVWRSCRTACDAPPGMLKGGTSPTHTWRVDLHRLVDHRNDLTTLRL